MNHHYIAFASFGSDWPLVNELYPNAAGARITLRALQSKVGADRPRPKLWVDAEIDSLHFSEILSSSRSDFKEYREYLNGFANANAITADKPDTKLVGEFVKSVLDSVKAKTDEQALGYISVPQLPYRMGAKRNKINRMLAEATLKWKSAQRKPPRFILPVILSDARGQTDLKGRRTEKIKVAQSCFEISGAEGIWVVDSTLDDHDDAGTLENRRFPGIINFHEELNSVLPVDTVTIAGPYWGLNLALWARGLVRFPAIGVGRSFQYIVPGRNPP